jgi:predicted nucleic acid-binding protein
MFMPDVNIRVYAHRERERTHEQYARWLKDVADSGEPFSLSVLVAVRFVRIVTDPRIYEEPTPLPVPSAVARVPSALRPLVCLPPSPTLRAP